MIDVNRIIDEESAKNTWAGKCLESMREHGKTLAELARWRAKARRLGEKLCAQRIDTVIALKELRRYQEAHEARRVLRALDGVFPEEIIGWEGLLAAMDMASEIVERVK